MATLATTIGRGTLASRPATMPEGSLYFVTDTSTMYRSDGADWDPVEAAAGTSYTAENARDDIGSALVAGTGIDITLDDAANTIAIAVEPGGAPPTSHTHPSTEIADFAEAVDDRVGALLVEGSGIDLTYDDGAGTLTVAAAGGGAAPPAPIPGWNTGRWYGLQEAGLPQFPAGAAMLANRLYFVPLLVPAAKSVDRIGISVTGLAAATTIRLGIYGPMTGSAPGPLILDAGTVDSSTTGSKELTISQALAAGWYHLGIIANGAPQVWSAAGWSWAHFHGQAALNGSSKEYGWVITNAAYHAALPASVAIGALTNIGTGPIPMVRAA